MRSSDIILKVITKLLKSTIYANDANNDAVAIADNDTDAAANNDVTNDDDVDASDILCCQQFLMLMLLTPGNDAR